MPVQNRNGYLCWFARTAITNGTIFSQVFLPQSCYQQVKMAVFSTCLPRVFPLYVSFSVPHSLLSYKDTSHTGLEPPLMTSFYPNYLMKDYLKVQSHSEELGVRTSTYKFWRNTIQPVTVSVSGGLLSCRNA